MVDKNRVTSDTKEDQNKFYSKYNFCRRQIRNGLKQLKTADETLKIVLNEENFIYEKIIFMAFKIQNTIISNSKIWKLLKMILVFLIY